MKGRAMYIVYVHRCMMCLQAYDMCTLIEIWGTSGCLRYNL